MDVMVSEPEVLPIRLLTHNVRYATTTPFKGEEPWRIRAPRLINELRYHTKYNAEAFVCLQEVLHDQLVDIQAGLNRGASKTDEWSCIGVGRDDGDRAGEYSPIFFRPAAWKLEEFTTVWLSETPDKPSKGWDATLPRTLTIGIFEHRKSKQKLVAMNTHLDDRGVKARAESARLIIEMVKKYTDQGSGLPPLPVFLAGDFNSEPEQEAYQILNASESPVKDLRELSPEEERYGNENTFTGFGFEYEPAKRIDFLFLRPINAPGTQPQWSIKGYAVLENRFEDGVYLSDHRAVVGDVSLSLTKPTD